jgi:hypothetical protein
MLCVCMPIHIIYILYVCMLIHMLYVCMPVHMQKCIRNLKCVAVNNVHLFCAQYIYIYIYIYQHTLTHVHTNQERVERDHYTHA